MKLTSAVLLALVLLVGGCTQPGGKSVSLTEAQIAEILEENANTVHSRLRAAHKEFDRAVQRCRSRDEWRLR